MNSQKHLRTLARDTSLLISVFFRAIDDDNIDNETIVKLAPQIEGMIDELSDVLVPMLTSGR